MNLYEGGLSVFRCMNICKVVLTNCYNKTLAGFIREISSSQSMTYSDVGKCF